MSYTLRDATKADLTAIDRIAQITQTEHNARVPDDFPDDAVAASKKSAAHILRGGPSRGCVVVADLDGDAVGYAVLSISRVPSGPNHHEVWGHILDISIAPEHRGNGLGTNLLERVATQAKKLGVTRVEGHVWSGNDASAALFAKSGYAPTYTGYRRRLAPRRESSLEKSQSVKRLLRFGLETVGLIVIVVVFQKLSPIVLGYFAR